MSLMISLFWAHMNVTKQLQYEGCENLLPEEEVDIELL